MAKCLHADVGDFAAHFEEVIQAWCYAVWSKNPRGGAGLNGESDALLPLFPMSLEQVGGGLAIFFSERQLGCKTPGC